MPELSTTDSSPEFAFKKFTTYDAGQSCLQHIIDSQSPWQEGRTERIGGSLKKDMRNVVRERGIVTAAELDMALNCAMGARNRYPNSSGYSTH